MEGTFFFTITAGILVGAGRRHRADLERHQRQAGDSRFGADGRQPGARSGRREVLRDDHRLGPATGARPPAARPHPDGPVPRRRRR